MNSNRLLSKILTVHQPFLTVSWVIWTEATHQPMISHEFGSIRFYADWSLSGAGELGGAQRKAGEKSLNQATSEGDRSKWNPGGGEEAAAKEESLWQLTFIGPRLFANCSMRYIVIFPVLQMSKLKFREVKWPILHSYWLLELFQTHDYPSQGSRLQKWHSIPDQIRLDKMSELWGSLEIILSHSPFYVWSQKRQWVFQGYTTNLWWSKS